MSPCRNTVVALLAATLLACQPLAGDAALPAAVGEQALPSLAPMLERTTPTVVNISARGRVQVRESPLLQDPFFRFFFDLPPRAQRPRERMTSSLGSGVVVDAERGYILTNHHVIARADEITVTLRDTRTLQAEVVGSDPEVDIAVIKVPPEDLQAITIGDSDQLRVGDFVVAIGNPFGLGQTVTSGIVSALGRRGLGIEGYEDFIQTDASINPGNSGGALINSRGELIGINTAIIGPSGGNVGIGFAVPGNVARAVMDQLIEHGEVRRGRIGVVIQDLTPAIAEALGLERAKGTVVTQVEPGSPAARAGLQPGDVIVTINGNEVENSGDLSNRVSLLEIGARVELEYLRDGRRRRASAAVAGPDRAAAQ